LISWRRPKTDLQPRINSFLILQHAVEEAVAAGAIRSGNPVSLSDFLWSTFHGIVALAIRMPDFFDAQHAQQAAALVLEVISKGIRP
jgi:hypothetical protein